MSSKINKICTRQVIGSTLYLKNILVYIRLLFLYITSQWCNKIEKEKEKY